MSSIKVATSKMHRISASRALPRMSGALRLHGQDGRCFDAASARNWIHTFAATDVCRHDQRITRHMTAWPSFGHFNRDGASALCSVAQMQVRTFGKKKDNAPSSKPLTNEALIANIMRKSGAESPDDCSVRLIVEEHRGKETQQPQQNGSDSKKANKKPKSVVSIVPLSTAIQTAVEKDLDLVEISIDQEVPVVKVVKLSAVLYRSERNKRSGSKGGALAEKEFQFKVQIADNDLSRKLTQMESFLDKGHRCSVRVRCPGWIAREDERTLERFLKRLKKQVEEGDAKTTSSKLDMNEQRTMGRLYFERKAKQKVVN